MVQLWVGVDIGKNAHHAVAVDGNGRQVLSRRVANDERDIAAVVCEVAALGTPQCWAIDVTTGIAALLLVILRRHRLEIRYVSGFVAHQEAKKRPGENKTDARDAAIIAHTARITPDLPVLMPADDLLCQLQLLIGRTDLTLDRAAALMRLQGLLTAISPAVERAVDWRRKGPLLVLGYWQTPQAIRMAGVRRIEAVLRQARIRTAATVAEHLVAAAQLQQIEIPAQQATAAIVAELTTDILNVDRRLHDLGKTIETELWRHPLAATITSLPGFGKILAAELLVLTSGLCEYTSAAKLAAHAGLAPVSHDSGVITGNFRRPQHFHRRLRYVFFYSTLTAIRTCPASRTFYDRKRAEGKRHAQAILALARRRVDVLWAMIRDNTLYQQRAEMP